MHAERSITTGALHAQPSQAKPQAHLSVSVAPNDAGPLRRALFAQLDGRIQRLVIACGGEAGLRGPRSTLHLVISSDAVDAALHIVMSTASSAQFGPVRHFQAEPVLSPSPTAGEGRRRGIDWRRLS